VARAAAFAKGVGSIVVLRLTHRSPWCHSRPERQRRGRESIRTLNAVDPLPGLAAAGDDTLFVMAISGRDPGLAVLAFRFSTLILRSSREAASRRRFQSAREPPSRRSLRDLLRMRAGIVIREGGDPRDKAGDDL